MTCQKNTDLCMFSGDDLRVLVEVYDEDGQLVDITNASAITWSLSNNVNSVALLTKSLGSGIVKSNPTTFYFDLTPANTSALNGSYYHEAEITTSSGKKHTAMSGRFTIKPTLI